MGGMQIHLCLVTSPGAAVLCNGEDKNLWLSRGAAVQLAGVCGKHASRCISVVSELAEVTIALKALVLLKYKPWRSLCRGRFQHPPLFWVGSYR